MSNTQFVLLLAQVWLMICVAHPLKEKSSAAFMHSAVWMSMWLWLVLR